MQETLEHFALGEQGESITVAVTSAGTFDPATSAVTGQTTTSMTVRARVHEVADRLVDGVNLKAGDRIAMVPVQAALTIAPDPSTTRVTVGGVVCAVVRMRTYRDAGTIVGYQLVLRGAT